MFDRHHPGQFSLVPCSQCWHPIAHLVLDPMITNCFYLAYLAETPVVDHFSSILAAGQERTLQPTIVEHQQQITGVIGIALALVTFVALGRLSSQWAPLALAEAIHKQMLVVIGA